MLARHDLNEKKSRIGAYHLATGGAELRMEGDQASVGRTLDQLILEPTFDGDVDAVYFLPPGTPAFLVAGFGTAPLTGPPLACLFLPRPMPSPTTWTVTSR